MGVMKKAQKPIVLEYEETKELKELKDAGEMHYASGSVEIRKDDITIRSCLFEKCSIHGTLTESEFTDATFSHCDLSNLNLNGSLLQRVYFDHCRLTGIHFNDCSLKDVTFEECEVSWSSFANAKVRTVSMTSSRFIEAGFTLVDQKNLMTEHCILNGAEFTGTNMAGMDISSCETEGILVQAPYIKNLTVNTEQAASFALLLGLKVV